MPKISSINKVSPIGTSFQGYLLSSYENIVRVYGDPMEGDYKTDVEWVIKWEDGLVGTIYNWKNGKNYLGEKGLEVEDITEWNIGGAKKIVETRINNQVKNSWPIFDEIRMEAEE